jgi:hypothetical protein
MSLIERTIRERTHGEPPDRASFGGSDDKWDGYLLGVEEAGAVAADLHQGAVEDRVERGWYRLGLQLVEDDLLPVGAVTDDLREKLKRALRAALGGGQ